MKKNILGKVLLAGALLLVVAGCSTKDKEEGKVSKKSQEEIEVWLTPQWQGTYSADEEGADYDSFFKTAAKMYEEEHPGKKISVQVIPGDERDSKLSVATQTETLPDIFFDSTFVLSTFAHQGLLAPFNDKISDASKTDISQAIWDNVSIGEDVYFYPFAQNPGMLTYNVQMFKDAGLEEYIGTPDEIVNWSVDDFKKILQALKENNPDVAPLGLYAKNNQADTWNMMYLRMFGNPFYNDAGEIVVNEPDGVEALELIKNLNDEGLTTTGPESLSSNDVNAMFQNQQVAISFTNAVLYDGMLDNMENGTMEKFDAQLANIPVNPQPLSFTYVLGSAVFNTNGDERLDLAQDFVSFYSENEDLIAASMNFLPVRQSVIDTEKDNMPLLNTYANNDQYIVNFSNNTPGYPEIRNALFPELQAALTGEKTPQEALDSFAEGGNKAIEKGLSRSKATEDKK